jgi:MFS family permease
VGGGPAPAGSAVGRQRRVIRNGPAVVCHRGRLLGHGGLGLLFRRSGGAIDAALNAYAVRHFGPRPHQLDPCGLTASGAATSPLILTAVVTVGTSWRWAYLVVLAVQGVVAVLFAITAGRWSEVRPPLVTSTRGEPRTILVRPRWRAKSRPSLGC